MNTYIVVQYCSAPVSFFLFMNLADDLRSEFQVQTKKNQSKKSPNLELSKIQDHNVSLAKAMKS